MIDVEQPGFVRQVEHAHLAAGSSRWQYTDAHRAAIDNHWQAARLTHPGYFNGRVHVAERVEFDGDTVLAQFVETDFKSYLYWRDQGYPAAGVADGFGSALLHSADGAIILGRQRAGNINAGLAYLPGGFIDARDVAPDGSIDIRASVARELVEETGLTTRDVRSGSGILVTRTGPHLSFAVPFHSPLDAAALSARIAAHIASETNPELASAVAVRRRSDLVDLAMPGYARLLLQTMLPD